MSRTTITLMLRRSGSASEGPSGSPRLRRTRLAGATAALTVLTALVPAVVTSDLGRHGTSKAAAAPAQSTLGGADGSMDPATRVLLQQQLDAARRVALRYPTLALALRAGYAQAAPYAPGIGSHYMKYSLIYRPFNAAAPSMLLFSGDDPTSRIVGLAYYVYDSQGPPQGFAGPFDHWHQHTRTCVGRTGAHFEGDDSAIECRGRGRNAWMLHLWVTPGYQTVNLIFSNFCTILT